MQIVIDIDDRVYGLLKYFEKSMGLNDKKDSDDDVKTALMRAVINGTPLPKGHGKIGDLDRLYNVFEKNVVSADAFKELFDLAPTIIEADTEGSESE